LHHPDVFCYICGEYILKASRKPIFEFVKRAYVGYFGVKLRDQDKLWAPHIVCKTCTEHLRQWTNGKRSCLKFGVPMVWWEQKNHFDDCYFCAVNIIGINRNNHDLPSARRLVPHSDLVPVPLFRELPQLSEDESCMSAIAQGKESGGRDSGFQITSHSEGFDQNELSDLIRDLNLSKDLSELLASRLKEKNVLQLGTKITFYRRREKYLLPFFTKDKNLVFCNDIGNLLKKTGLSEYNPSEWRLLIDILKSSLK